LLRLIDPEYLTAVLDSAMDAPTLDQFTEALGG